MTVSNWVVLPPGVLWANLFETYRRRIMSTSMVAIRGKLQKEGKVIHVICDRVTDHNDMLRDLARSYSTIPPRRGDGATSAGGLELEPESSDTGILALG